MPEDRRTAVFETIADAGLEICVVGSGARFALPSAPDRKEAVDQADRVRRACRCLGRPDRPRLWWQL